MPLRRAIRLGCTVSHSSATPERRCSTWRRTTTSDSRHTQQCSRVRMLRSTSSGRGRRRRDSSRAPHGCTSTSRMTSPTSWVSMRHCAFRPATSPTSEPSPHSSAAATSSCPTPEPTRRSSTGADCRAREWSSSTVAMSRPSQRHSVAAQKSGHWWSPIPSTRSTANRHPSSSSTALPANTLRRCSSTKRTHSEYADQVAED